MAGKQIRIGILGAADIAVRRFLPALQHVDGLVFAGVAISGESRREKAEEIISRYGGAVYPGYEALLQDTEVEAVYIPQPPAFHYRWAEQALRQGKHVLLEKPGTTTLPETEALIALARQENLALAENYAFCHHGQIALIRSAIAEGMLGRLRLIRAAFGFPYRDSGDFRYHAALGGGALLDCGGYTLKAAQMFLGDTTRVCAASLVWEDIHDVDLFGSVMLENRDGLTAQVSFGMDNSYKCELEIWGSKGCLLSPRLFTPPADLAVNVNVRTAEGEKILTAHPDDQFGHMAERFLECIREREAAEAEYDGLRRQMQLMEQVREKAAGVTG